MSVDLVPEWTIGDLCLTSYPFGVDADSTVDIGEPEMVVESVTSQLADGDLERVVRHGNRAYVLEVYVEGPSLAEIATAEAVLRAQLRRPGLTLTHDPGDGFTPASVYEVQTAKLTPQRDDQRESHLIRKFTITLTCGPWARSVDLTTVASLAAPEAPVAVTVNNADSLTGWVASATNYLGPTTPSFTDQGNFLRVALTSSRPTISLRLPGLSESMTTTRYLRVEVSGDAVAPPTFSVKMDGGGSFVTLLPVLSTATGGGTTVHFLDTQGIGSVLNEVRVGKSYVQSPSSVALTLNVHDVTRTNVLVQVSARQVARIIETGGTERTPASIEVAPRVGGETLKLTIVHTSPRDGSGYSPALRQRRASGNTVTTDSARVSGAREPVLVNPIVAQMPLLSVPEGEYVLVALMRSSVAGTFSLTWQARTFFSGSYLGGVSDTVSATFTDAGFWTTIPLGVVTLPPVRAATSDAHVELTLNRAPVGAEVVDLDEWWAFRHGDGCALTMVASGSTSFLWLDSPDLSNSVPRIWTGVEGDRSDARHPGAALLAQGSHHLHPEGTAVFVASEGIENPAVSATYYKRWHSNAAE